MNREPRPVGFKTIFDLLKQKRTHLTLGLVFTLMPLGVGVVLLSVFTMLDSDVPKVDYEQVNKNGQSTTATITKIVTQQNVTINDQHPSIISYKYSNGDKEIETQYRVLDPDKIQSMNVGDTIEVKYLSDSSILPGLERFEFPLGFFLRILTPLLVVGLALLIFLYLRVRNEIDLYRRGEVRDAQIISMTLTRGLPISGIGQGITVHYRYDTTRGQSIVGESFTNDYSLLNSRKQGDIVKIFVSADDESKSCLISKLDEVRNNWKI
jgi:hypothetical protein